MGRKGGRSDVVAIHPSREHPEGLAGVESLDRIGAAAMRVASRLLGRRAAVSHAGDFTARCAGFRNRRRSPLERTTRELRGAMPRHGVARSVRSCNLGDDGNGNRADSPLSVPGGAGLWPAMSAFMPTLLPITDAKNGEMAGQRPTPPGSVCLLPANRNDITTSSRLGVKMMLLQRLSLYSLLALVCMSAGLAQTERGSIAGTIQDSSGAVIPAAKVTVTNATTNVASTLTSTGTGDYSAVSLPPGVYAIT